MVKIVRLFDLSGDFYKTFSGDLLLYIKICYHKHLNQIIMNSLLYIIAVILIIGWAVGVFFTAVGSLIHVLLVIAIIAILFGLLRKPTAV